MAIQQDVVCRMQYILLCLLGIGPLPELMIVRAVVVLGIGIKALETISCVHEYLGDNIHGTQGRDELPTPHQ